MGTEWLTEHPRVPREFLPAYAPTVNVIERFWKCAREPLVKNTEEEKDTTFRAPVFRVLNPVDADGEALTTLRVEKFQIIHPKTASFQVEDLVVEPSVCQPKT